MRGDKFFSYPIKVLYLPSSESYSSYMISVPKRVFKKAVTRNLIKRRIREVIRTSGYTTNSYSSNFDFALIYIGKEVPLYSQLKESIDNALEKIFNSTKKSADIPIDNSN